MGNVNVPAESAGPFTLAGAAHAGADPPAPQDLSGTMGRQGAAYAAAESAKAAVPSEGLRAGRSCGRNKPEYNAAHGRLDHATFQERNNASVRCTGLGVKLYMPMSDEAWAGYFVSDVWIFYRFWSYDSNQ